MSLLRLLKHLLKPKKWVGDGKIVSFIGATFTPNNCFQIVTLTAIDTVISIVYYYK